MFLLYVRSPGKITAIFLDMKSIIYGSQQKFHSQLKTLVAFQHLYNVNCKCYIWISLFQSKHYIFISSHLTVFKYSIEYAVQSIQSQTAVLFLLINLWSVIDDDMVIICSWILDSKHESGWPENMITHSLISTANNDLLCSSGQRY